MGSLSTKYKRIFLRSLKWTSEENESSLFDVLKSAARARVSETESGLYLSATSANGASVNYALPSGSGDVSPTAITELCSELIDLYEAAKYKLGNDASDDDLFSEMLLQLVAVRSYSTDFGGLR